LLKVNSSGYDIRVVANKIKNLLNKNIPDRLDLHTPYYYGNKQFQFLADSDKIFAIAGRCARISYNSTDEITDINLNIKLGVQLFKNGHLSPFEHFAVCSGDSNYHNNFHGWISGRKLLNTMFN